MMPLVFIALLTWRCEGPQGSQGLPGIAGQPGAAGQNGKNGQDGKNGEDGTDGQDGLKASYILSIACQKCHPEKYEQWKNSGHAHAMKEVNAAKPADPPFSIYPDQPPHDDQGKTYTWTDITYIVGGFGWKANFSDATGFLITGAKTEYVLASTSWQAFEKSTAPGTKTMGCPACHTLSYKRADGHEILEKKYDLDGVEGDWITEGVHCENCHGPGSIHSAAQGYAAIRRDRTATRCGTCHGAPPLNQIAARNGLIVQAQQYNELLSTKMRLTDCVDCHNPHQSAKHAESTVNPNKGITTPCETCHYKEVTQQKVANHLSSGAGPSCVICHMPEAVTSALGDGATWSGDMRSHLFRINPTSSAAQFSTDGKTAKPYLTLNFTCRQCHGMSKTDQELELAARGYHDPIMP